MASSVLDRAGIYRIVNRVSGRAYVGSAINIRKRWNVHKTLLRKGRHHSPTFQRSWNKNGPECFVWYVLEFVNDPSELLIREQEYLDEIASIRETYNVNPVAGSSLGRKLSKETREKIAARAVGRKVTEETRRKMSKARKARVTSPETAEKIAQANRERAKVPISEKTRKRMSESARRRVKNYVRASNGTFISP